MTTLANTIRFIDGHYAEAEDLYRRALEIELRVVGPDHPYTTRAQRGWRTCCPPSNVTLRQNRYCGRFWPPVNVFSGANILTLCCRNTTWQRSSSRKIDIEKRRR